MRVIAISGKAESGKDTTAQELRNILEENNKKVMIIHFADVLKPWFKECDNPYKGLYWYYLGLTPWANDKASYKYKLAKRILLYIKRYLKHILSLLGFRRYIQFNFNQN